METGFSWGVVHFNCFLSCAHHLYSLLLSALRAPRACVCGGVRDHHLGDVSLAIAHASLSTSPFFASRAAWLLVIGCVGGIMTLGGGRRQRSMKQNTAWCAAPGTLWFLRSALHLTKMSESVRRKQSNITAHCPRLCGVRCHSLYNLPHGELLWPRRADWIVKRMKSLIISFLTVLTVLLAEVREGWFLITAALLCWDCKGLLES